MFRLATILSACGLLFTLVHLAQSDTPPRPLSPPASLTGQVIKVADGDTLTLRSKSGEKVRIRLLHIDAPESGQAFGSKSAKHLRKLVRGKQVRIEGTKKDRYGRRLGVVIREDGLNVNEAMVAAGYAWWFRQYSKDKGYERLESEAQAAKSGLWADSKARPPWEYRHPKPDPNAAVYGNRRSGKYHLSHCSGYRRIAEKNRIVYKSAAAALADGYIKAGNCR
ncbi:MAG: micrococcal nuclease [Myxococcota bacterium]|jgi:micrococcal nuclease